MKKEEIAVIKYVKLTEKQKLYALEFKYYQHHKWEPKKGDYYTTSRSDLELYMIVNEDENFFYTKFCNPSFGDLIENWKKDEFLKDFGICRVFVPDTMLINKP